MESQKTCVLLQMIEAYVTIRIHSLIGLPVIDEFEQRIQENYSSTTFSKNYELFVEVVLYQMGKPLCVAACTDHQIYVESSIVFNEVLRIPVRYKDLNHDAQLAVTLYTVSSELNNDNLSLATEPIPLGSVTIPLLDQSRFLRPGRLKMKLCQNCKADGGFNAEMLYRPEENPMTELEKLEQRLLHGNPPNTGDDWLNELVKRRVNNLQEKLRTRRRNEVKGRFERRDKNLYLTIEFPNFAHQVAYKEPALYTINDRNVPSFYTIDDSANDSLAHLQDNPIDRKNKKLVRSRADRLYADQKPNVEDKMKLAKIGRVPVYNLLTAEEKELLWRVRNHITNESNLLTKFLRTVDWKDSEETEKAQKLMQEWNEINSIDALELLSKDFMGAPCVREHGIKILRDTTAEQFGMYLPQLIYALRHEEAEKFPSPLHKFILDKSLIHFKHVNTLWWSLAVYSSKDQPYWQAFERYSRYVEQQLRDKRPDYLDQIKQQKVFVSLLSNLMERIQSAKIKAQEKTKLVRRLLKTDEYKLLRKHQKPFPLPIRPDIMSVGIEPNECKVFASAMCPLMITLNTTTQKEYKVIWKFGDDLRQDALIIQILHVMDELLKEVNMDLNLSPYPVMATTMDYDGCGFLEFVPDTTTVFDALKENNNDIRHFIQRHNKKANLETAMQNYASSLAGYSVFSYILGIGDRHLHNLLITKTGKLLHIDFGFIYGHDPKPWPPPMKICKEMVQALGGKSSTYYRQFESQACLCYNLLRKHSRLIINLLKLIGEDSPDNDKNMEFVIDKFQLKLSDDEASLYLKDLIDKSVSAVMAQVSDIIHRYATYFR